MADYTTSLDRAIREGLHPRSRPLPPAGPSTPRSDAGLKRQRQYYLSLGYSSDRTMPVCASPRSVRSRAIHARRVTPSAVAAVPVGAENVIRTCGLDFRWRDLRDEDEASRSPSSTLPSSACSSWCVFLRVSNRTWLSRSSSFATRSPSCAARWPVRPCDQRIERYSQGSHDFSHELVAEASSSSQPRYCAGTATSSADAGPTHTVESGRPMVPAGIAAPRRPVGSREPDLGLPADPGRARHHGHRPSHPSSVWAILKRLGTVRYYTKVADL